VHRRLDLQTVTSRRCGLVRRRDAAAFALCWRGRRTEAIAKEWMMRVLSMIGLGLTAMALAACGGKKEPAADTATPPAAEVAAPAADAAAPEPPPADCVSAEVQATLNSLEPDFARLDGRALRLCGAVGEARHCVVLDLDSGKRTTEKLPDDDVQHLPAYPAGFDDGLLKDEGRPVLKLCADSRCKDLYVGEVLAGHFDAARARVVLTTWDDDKERRARIFDTATQAEVAAFPIGPADLRDCTFAAFVGESLLVSTGACTGGGRAWLVDAKNGTKLGDIGKSPSAFVKDGQLALLDGTLWAFRDASGKAVYVQDVASGEVVATVDLETAADGTAPKDEHAFLFGSPSELVLVEARPVVGSVFIANPKDGAVTKKYLPRPCP
jgi:hypothetical protein